MSISCTSLATRATLHSIYRTHTCGALGRGEVGTQVRLCGWLHRKRDHGSLLFVDVRDHYGITQCVAEEGCAHLEVLHATSVESVVQITGKVVQRSEEARNPKLTTGEIEVVVQDVVVLSAAASLPMTVNTSDPYPEETRLKYRFLDLRREDLHRRIEMRCAIIAMLRDKMTQSGFLEVQTPILTATSPEGARDYVVPSRLYPGEFYALPQAPQQFKQLLMTAGFDRYFQIAPCFRDESSRADRSPGEFYQLDMEMAFVEQEDVWNAIEPVLHGTFCHFAPEGFSVTPLPFPRISYDDAMLRYGTDKPDLRNPLSIEDYTHSLDLPIFQEAQMIRGIVAPLEGLSRKVLKDLETWVQEQGGKGLGYVIKTATDDGETATDDGRAAVVEAPPSQLKGPLAKFLTEEQQAFLQQHLPMECCLLLLAGSAKETPLLAGRLRTHLGHVLHLIQENTYSFCWVKDFPMYERDEETGAIVFSHNPFSMPQGGKEALETQDPLCIKAYQYDIVCNGIELCSGAIRNHDVALMYKAFAIAGYDQEHVQQEFGSLLRAFQYGAPPHGGCAPGIERMVMLLTQQQNIREITPFPLTQNARDVLMGAPSPLSPQRWKELHLTSAPSSVAAQKLL